MKTLFHNLYTVRFEVKDGVATPYGLPVSMKNNPFLPKLSGIPNGMYEFYYGKGYKIGVQGLSFALEENHPLYNQDPSQIQMLYNLGMEFDTRFSPDSHYPSLFPLRYVYFREGALYTMGAPLFAKEDPILHTFIENESKKAYPFIDKGAPLKEDGTLDVAFIQSHGLKIPKKMYLALGDNHAVSADSREFGFVPQENLKGAPDWIFWPVGSRFGHPNQSPYPVLTLPRSIVWTVIAICIGGAFFWHRRRNKLPKF